MPLYEFMDLIQEYSVPLKITMPQTDDSGQPEQGHYDPDTGEWVPADTSAPVQTGTADNPTTIIAAFVPFTQSASGQYGLSTSYGTGGTYTSSDRQLIVSADVTVPMKSKIEWHGLAFSVEEEFPYQDFADFHVYACKAVSVFD